MSCHDAAPSARDSFSWRTWDRKMPISAHQVATMRQLILSVVAILWWTLGKLYLLIPSRLSTIKQQWNKRQAFGNGGNTYELKFAVASMAWLHKCDRNCCVLCEVVWELERACIYLAQVCMVSWILEMRSSKNGNVRRLKKYPLRSVCRCWQIWNSSVLSIWRYLCTEEIIHPSLMTILCCGHIAQPYKVLQLVCPESLEVYYIAVLHMPPDMTKYKAWRLSSKETFSSVLLSFLMWVDAPLNYRSCDIPAI